MPRITLALNSHQLQYYKKCDELYRLSEMEQLETAQPKTAFVKGSVIHEMLALYYRLLRRKWTPDNAMFAVLRRYQRYQKVLLELNRRPKFIEKILKENNHPMDALVSQEEILLFATRFTEYVVYHAQDKVKPYGIEVGFSEIFYQDKNFLFIYEGKMDWIGDVWREDLNEYELEFWDHKTMSRDYQLLVETDQFKGYTWALGKIAARRGKEYKNYGRVNYFGLQKTGKPEELFKQEVFHFRPAQIKEWYKETLYWFHRIVASRQFQIYHRSWNCDEKFGKCKFLPLCRMEDKTIRESLKKVYFVKKPKIWRSWE